GVADAFSHDARDRVGGAAGGKRHDQADRMRGIVVGKGRAARSQRQRNRKSKRPRPHHSVSLIRPDWSRVCRFGRTIMQKSASGPLPEPVELYGDASDAGPKSGGKMLQQVDVTKRLAHYVAATRWDDVPPEVWHQAKRSFMNLFAVAL